MSKKFNWRRAIKIVVLGLAAIVTFPIALLFVTGSVMNMWGRYAHPHGPRETEGLNYEFTASPALAVFTVHLSRDAHGLVVVDRETATARLISLDRTFLDRPRLSSDGERLLFVRHEAGHETRELLICTVTDWKCRVLWRTANTIHSQIEIEKDTVLFLSSPKIVRSDGQVRFSDNDFYLIRAGSEPNKLTDFSFYAVYSLAVMGDRILFSAFGAGRAFHDIFPSRGIRDADSEIFSLNFDRSKPEIENPTRVLQPLYLPESGYSTYIAASNDARLVAYLNRVGPGSYKNHLVVAEPDGAARKRVTPTGYGFSRPAFVGRTVLAKELTEKEWVIRAFDVDADTETTIAKFDLSTDFSKLEPIAISISE
jgi:hypothetical protein